MSYAVFIEAMEQAGSSSYRLVRGGMHPRALSEVADVVDERWRNALEALLVRDRETVITLTARTRSCATGGRPTRVAASPTRAGCSRVQADAPTFHWGNMDAGGVRIFRHIKRHLALLGVTCAPT